MVAVMKTAQSMQGARFAANLAGEAIGLLDGKGVLYGLAKYFYAPSGDLTGVRDRADLEAVIAKAAVHGGRVDIGEGQYWVSSKDRATTNLDRGIPVPANVYVNAVGAGANFKVVVGSKCNVFEFQDSFNSRLENMVLDGQRVASIAWEKTGGDADALRNGIRIVRGGGLTFANVDLVNFPYHGCIGVGDVQGAIFQNVRTSGNGFRSIHFHEETGTPRNIRIDACDLDGDGQSDNTAIICSGQVLAGSLNKVRLSAANAARFAAANTAMPKMGLIDIKIPGAGNGGADHFTNATLSATNPDANNDLTVNIAAFQANAAPVTIHAMTGKTSGLFPIFGCTDVQISNTHIRNMPGYGLDIRGAPLIGTSRLQTQNVTIDNCGIGVLAGTTVDNALIDDLTLMGITITRPVFEGVVVGNVAKFTLDATIDGAGLCGVRATTIQTSMRLHKIEGSITNCGAAGVYYSGQGVLSALKVSADTYGNGKNPGFANNGLATIYGTNPQGWGQGVLVRGGAVDLFKAVIVDQAISHENAGGAVHIDQVNLANVRIRSALDNVPAAGGAVMGIRITNCPAPSVDAEVMLSTGRTSSEYAIAVSAGCTNGRVRNCKTNYNRGSGAGVIYINGAGSTGYDNTIIGSGVVQFAGGAAAASNAAMQRTA